jgi:hypothetical protein
VPVPQPKPNICPKKEERKLTITFPYIHLQASKMTMKKCSVPNWQLIPNFFIAHLPILVRCKTKGAVGASYALLRNWQLGA